MFLWSERHRQKKAPWLPTVHWGCSRTLRPHTARKHLRVLQMPTPSQPCSGWPCGKSPFTEEPKLRQSVGTAHGSLKASRVLSTAPSPPPGLQWPIPGRTGRSLAGEAGPGVSPQVSGLSWPTGRCIWSCRAGLCCAGPLGSRWNPTGPPPWLLCL